MYPVHERESYKSQAGFTLVELAVVMIIIGLLIGGVLKGQELINNAQVTATISQVEGYDAASTTFRDIYDSFPGDLTNPATRLPSCTGLCAVAGNGNNRLEWDLTGAPGSESDAFFPQLAAADLIGGVNPAAVNADAGIWGEAYPEAEVGGSGFLPGFFAGGALGVMTAANPARSGHYMALTATADAAPAPAITPSEAFRVDNKLDDGVADSGSVFAGQAGTCSTAADYLTANQADNCHVFIRFQN